MVTELKVSPYAGLLLDFLTQSGRRRSVHCRKLCLCGLKVISVGQGFQVSSVYEGRKLLVEVMDDVAYLRGYP